MRRFRVTEAVPRKPLPKRAYPTPEQIASAREEYALHIRSLVHAGCLSCGALWPCPTYHAARAVLERGNQFDVNGRLKDLPGQIPQ